VFVNDRILTLNVGASKLVLAEFAIHAGKPPALLNYGIGELGIEPDNETDASPYIVVALRDIMRKTGIKPAPLLIALSGQTVFPRFVKLPPVARDKIESMIRYEAEQNVPFPINEVVWDYQLIGSAEAGEQHAMIVAVKTENIREITDCVVASGLDPEIVDVAPMALHNCVRYNYPTLTGCTMVLDIGARSTNLVFIEEGRVFSRTIPVAGNAITQELAKSLQITFKEAEEIKRSRAFVALGGAFSAGDDEMADRVSKVVRNVVTRLHAEISRSVNFYRSQQGGAAPTRILMTGGSSIIPHMDTFFREKLQVEVETLNPFVNITVGGGLDPRQVGEHVACLSEVAGLALRRSLACPVEINLMPPDLLKRRAFRHRIPFFALATCGILIMLAVWMLYARRSETVSLEEQNELSRRLAEVQKSEKLLKTQETACAATKAKADGLRRLIERRTDWIRIVSGVQDCLLDGMWLVSLEPIKDTTGQIIAIRLVGYGFKDKMDLVTIGKGSATAAELLCERLKKNTVFHSNPKIVDERSPMNEQYLRQFTIEAPLAHGIH